MSLVEIDRLNSKLLEARAAIATLTTEVDRLTGYSDRLNGLRERLEDSNATLTAELDRAQNEICTARDHLPLDLEEESLAVGITILRDQIKTLTAERQVFLDTIQDMMAERDALTTLAYVIPPSADDPQGDTYKDAWENAAAERDALEAKVAEIKRDPFTVVYCPRCAELQAKVESLEHDLHLAEQGHANAH